MALGRRGRAAGSRLRGCGRWLTRDATASSTSCCSAPPASPAGSPPSTSPGTPRRAALGAGRPQPGQARGGPRPAGRARPGAGRAAAAARRRRPTRRRWPTSPPRTKVVDHHRRPLPRSYGEPLVAACAEAGTDYVDLTGEPEFVDRMYVAHHATAVAHRCPDRARLRLRLDPARPRRLFTVQQLPADVPDHGARRRPRRRHGVRRHLPLGADGAVAARGRCGPRRRAPPASSRDPRAAVPRGRRQAAPRPAARLLAAAAADHRPVGRRAQRRGAGGVRPGLPLLPLRRHQDAAVRRRRRRRRRRRSAWPRRCRRCASCCCSRIPQGEGPDEARREKSWFTVDFVGEGGGPDASTPGSPAATPATARPRRCWPSRRSAWPSTTTPTAGQVTTAQAMGERLLDRLQRAGIRFEVAVHRRVGRRSTRSQNLAAPIDLDQTSSHDAGVAVGSADRQTWGNHDRGNMRRRTTVRVPACLRPRRTGRGAGSSRGAGPGVPGAG